MSFSQAIQSFFQQYANFQGRARRSEYWYVVLAAILVNTVLTLIADILPALGAALSALFSLAILIPNLALMTRRLHDIGKSGWNLLFSLIPLVGAIMLIVWFATDSQPGMNQYGTSAKYPNGIPFTHSQNHDYSSYTNHSPTSHAASYQPQYQQPQYQQPQPSSADSGTICPFCGAKNIATSKFCTTCGTTLDR